MHPAFDDRLLILPDLASGKQHTITIKLGAQPTTTPHLTYVSKHMTEAAPTSRGLAFNVKAKAKARFAVAVAEPAVVLNADWQEWDDSNGHIKGFVRSDRRIELAKVSLAGFHVTRANLPILALNEKPGSLALRLAGPGQSAPRISLRSGRKLLRATLSGQDLKFAEVGSVYELELPSFPNNTELILYFGSTSR